MADVVTCIYNSAYGVPCGAPAAVQVGTLVDPTCKDATTPIASLCPAHWDNAIRLLGVGMMAPCGCVVLEVIDLTKADPGPGYADMLRSL